MNQEGIRYTAAGIAIIAVAVISLATETTQGRPRKIDSSVPSASEVFHGNDGRNEGNTEDKTY
jgi:hypothetical protein